MSRHPLAVNPGITDRASEWEWLYGQVRTDVQNPQRLHRDSAGRLGAISARSFREVGDYCLPLSVGPTAAAQLFEMRNIATDRRITANKWTTDSPDVICAEFFEGAPQNVDRARVRLG